MKKAEKAQYHMSIANTMLLMGSIFILVFITSMTVPNSFVYYFSLGMLVLGIVGILKGVEEYFISLNFAGKLKTQKRSQFLDLVIKYAPILLGIFFAILIYGLNSFNLDCIGFLEFLAFLTGILFSFSIIHVSKYFASPKIPLK